MVNVIHPILHTAFCFGGGVSAGSWFSACERGGHEDGEVVRLRGISGLSLRKELQALQIQKLAAGQREVAMQALQASHSRRLLQNLTVWGLGRHGFISRRLKPAWVPQ